MIVSCLLALFCAVSLLTTLHVNASGVCADPDCFLSVPQLISEKGYPIETHDVVTADGYILTMHRIPRHGAPAVLLQHGLLDASETWVINERNNSLGFILHDAGFDVFMVQNRIHVKFFHKCSFMSLAEQQSRKRLRPAPQIALQHQRRILELFFH
jgi:hypothetical protein